jgi:hypothetical protein
MYMRAVTVRMIYVGIASAAILITIALREAAVQAVPGMALAHGVGTPARLPVVTLPTVHVSAVAGHAEAPAMPATRQRAIAAQQHAEGIEQADTDIPVSASLPSLRLDMPYYTFGKMLPHVAKE